MDFKMIHNNINVLDLQKSLDFYSHAFGFTEDSRITPASGEFIIVYLKDGQGSHRLELTWLRDRDTPYELGDNEIHLALETSDIEGALERHKSMDCVCFENPAMGIYFVEDPDGHWIEVLPAK
ncbi:MAG: VOC family protein [Eubacteriales bacterium]